MKTPSLVTAAAFAFAFTFAGSVFAQEATFDMAQKINAGKSRAEVVSELNQARANGSLQVTEADWPKIQPVGTPRNRADVRAETAAAAKSGELVASKP
jgi:hypothetical protein